jgi:hypothetical protein
MLGRAQDWMCPFITHRPLLDMQPGCTVNYAHCEIDHKYLK